MSKKPTICMVANHACIRVFKESVALKARGYEVHLIAAAEAPIGWMMYDTFSRFEGYDYLKRMVAFYSRFVDIFHIHNEPDELVRVVREATLKPIVFDIHDLNTLRVGKYPAREVEQQRIEEEKHAFHCADAFVHVSDPCRKAAEEVYGAEKPTIILISMVNLDLVAKDNEITSPALSIAYEGGVSENDAIESIMDDDGNCAVTANIRYYGPMVQSFRNIGYHVALFPARPVEGLTYLEMGACVHDPLPYHALLQALRVHLFGFVGGCISLPLMEAAMPNKLFEYMSQGVVPVCLFCNEVEHFVRTWECGIVLENFENLKDQIWDQDPLKKRERVLEIRKDLVIENQIDKLCFLYEELL